MASTCHVAPATATSGRSTAAIVYPATISGLRRFTRSDHQPLASLSSDAVASAAPSMIPTHAALAPSVAVRKAGSSG